MERVTDHGGYGLKTKSDVLSRCVFCILFWQDQTLVVTPPPSGDD